jgi:hypothetical protein
MPPQRFGCMLRTTPLACRSAIVSADMVRAASAAAARLRSAGTSLRARSIASS